MKERSETEVRIFSFDIERSSLQAQAQSAPPFKPGLDGAGEVVMGVDLVGPHVEENLQQLFLVLRLGRRYSLEKSVPSFLMWTQLLSNQLLVQSPGGSCVSMLRRSCDDVAVVAC